MLICVDIDDTVCNLQETVIGIFNKRYNTEYALEDFHNFDIMEVLPIEEATKFKAIYGESGVYDLVKPFVGSQEGLRKLMNDGHQIYFASNILPATHSEKVAFIQRYYPFIDPSRIIAIKDKWLLRTDVMIEDNLDNLLAKPYYERILIDRPWNQWNKDYVYGIRRCNNWSEIVAAVNQINEEE